MVITAKKPPIFGGRADPPNRPGLLVFAASRRQRPSYGHDPPNRAGPRSVRGSLETRREQEVQFAQQPVVATKLADLRSHRSLLCTSEAIGRQPAVSRRVHHVG